MKTVYNEEARTELLKGAKKLYKAVSTTFGPKGGNVAIHRRNQEPVLTHDGVTVAEAYRTLEDSPENTGVELIKSAAKKMGSIVGDGTTTVTVLTYFILKEAHKLIAAGHDPMEIRYGLSRAESQALKYIGDNTEVVKDKLREVAKISAGDESLGNIIADVIEKVGENGLVTVDRSSGFDVTADVTNGFEVSYGYTSPLMVTDQIRGVCEYNNPQVLVVKSKLNSISELLPILQAVVASQKKELLILAESIDGDALHNLVLNKIQGNLNVVTVGVPSYQVDILEDIARITKATIISPESGVKLPEATIEHLGRTSKVIVTKDTLSVIGGTGDIESKVGELKTVIAESKDENAVLMAKKRLARLTGAVGVIKVGGNSDTEIEEKKYRVDDAVAATQAAVRSGIVPGGGITYLNAANAITGEDVASDILRKALEQPTRHILDNAGVKSDEWLPKIKESQDGYGINIMSDIKIIDLKANGVIDPAEVTTEAVKTAVSIAGNVLTTGAVIVEERPNDA